jgi:hypothetical protein
MREVWFAGVRIEHGSSRLDAAWTGDVFGKQAGKYAHDAGLDKQCTP